MRRHGVTPLLFGLAVFTVGLFAPDLFAAMQPVDPADSTVSALGGAVKEFVGLMSVLLRGAGMVLVLAFLLLNSVWSASPKPTHRTASAPPAAKPPEPMTSR